MAAPFLTADATLDRARVDGAHPPVDRPKLLPSLRNRRQLVRVAAVTLAAVLLLGA